MKITVEVRAGEVTTRRSLEFDGTPKTPPGSVELWLAWLERGIGVFSKHAPEPVEREPFSYRPNP